MKDGMKLATKDPYCEDCGCPVARCDCAVGAIPLPGYRPWVDGLLVGLTFTWSITLTTIAMWVM